MHVSQVASYLGDDATASFTTTLLTKLVRDALVRHLAPASYLKSFPAPWPLIPEAVEALLRLPEDALRLVMSRFHAPERLSAPKPAINAWVDSHLHESSGELQLSALKRWPLASGDDFVKALASFWNAPATVSRCSALVLPSLDDKQWAYIVQCVGAQPSAPISDPFASALQPLTAVTSLTMGWAMTELRVLSQLLALFPKLEVLTMHSRSMPGPPTCDDLEQFVAQVCALPLKELSFTFWGNAKMCSHMCICLRQARHLTKLVLPKHPPATEFAPVFAVLPTLTGLRSLACLWPIPAAQTYEVALQACMSHLKALTCLTQLDLEVHRGFKGDRSICSLNSAKELQILTAGLNLSKFPSLRCLRYVAYSHVFDSPEEFTPDTLSILDQYLQKLHHLDVQRCHDEFRRYSGDDYMSLHEAILSQWWPPLHGCQANNEKNQVAQRPLVPLMPSLRACDSITDFSVSLETYVEAIGHDFGPLNAAMTILTALTHLAVCARPDKFRWRDYQEREEWRSCNAVRRGFLEVIARGVGDLTRLRSVCID
jgi:hypothetical protein